MLRDAVSTIYLIVLFGLALYGWLGLFTLWLFWRHRHDDTLEPSTTGNSLPHITVQLPLYNERYVVDGLIRAAVNLQYPANRLEIQVVDDSTDDTTERASELVDYYRRRGVNISLLHREHRTGYKAGALSTATDQARGEFIVIFDADFKPPPDFLYQTIPYFLNEPKLGVVQARWAHLNDRASLLTGAQAIALDKHFIIEQTVRYRARLFPKFNGTAGVWRRACLEDIGGWHPDTVCEDLCASTRAVLKGWNFRFLPNVVAPAELPSSVSAYRSQQSRWARGATQCLLKYGRQMLFCRTIPLGARLYGLLTMGSYTTSLLLIMLLLLQIPILYLDIYLPIDTLPFSVAGFGQPLLFLVSQRALYEKWKQRIYRLPVLLLTAIGLSAAMARAIVLAIFARQHVFTRTPKRGMSKVGWQDYNLPFDAIVILELLLALYSLAGAALALLRNRPGPLIFLFSCFLGFGYIVYLTLNENKAASQIKLKLNKLNNNIKNL